MARRNIEAGAPSADNKGRNDAEIAAYKERVEQLQRDGYIPMPIEQALGSAYDPSDASWSGIINSHFSASCDPCNPCNKGNNVGSLITSCGRERQVVDETGQTVSIIDWGSDNMLPNHVSLWSQLLPYTATSLDHKAELAAGMCVQPKFRFFDNNGEAHTIDYAAGGEWLRRKMREIAKEMDHGDGANEPNEPNGANKSNKPNTPNTTATTSALTDMVRDMLEDDFVEYDKAYNVWKQTNQEINDFLDRSNLPLLYLKWMQELTMLGVTMPEIELSQNGDVRSSAQWTPKAVALSHRPVMACRLSKRDADGRIRQAVLSNSWLSDRLPEYVAATYASLPLLDAQHPSTDLTTRLRDWRLAHPRASYADRPTRWLMPCLYPSVGQNYYPFMSWWSIFEGDIYPYLATIISDRAIRKRNSNSVGRIVYIHTEYLDSLNRETDAKKRLAEANKLRDEIFRQTTTFLNDKSKNGSTLMSFTFPNKKGEQTKALEIVDVPFANKQAADADKTELQEVASIVFFALSVHPELIGAIPGSAASKGGTYMREMLLIDEVTSASVLQQMMNKTLEVVASINGWDSKYLVWETPQKTLTTLDASKTGVKEE